MLLACAVAILVGVTVIPGNDVSFTFKNLHRDDVIFREGNLYSTPARSKINCSRQCIKHQGCVTFTFTKESSGQGTCRGHSAQPSNSTGVEARTNTSSYKLLVPEPEPRHCQAMKTLQPGSGLRQLTVPGITNNVTVYCDQDTANGGWTVIQRRQDGSVDFYRTWAEYQAGFGNPAAEFWLGLETMYRMTTSQRYELRFDLEMFDGTTGFAVYSNFSVGPSSDNYTLSLGGLTSGNIWDSFNYNRGRQFSTWDADHNNYPGYNCPVTYHGAWWYGGCTNVNLNGPYRSDAFCPGNWYNCTLWWSFGTVYNNSLRKTAMKIRPV